MTIRAHTVLETSTKIPFFVLNMINTFTHYSWLLLNLGQTQSNLYQPLGCRIQKKRHWKSCFKVNFSLNSRLQTWAPRSCLFSSEVQTPVLIRVHSTLQSRRGCKAPPWWWGWGWLCNCWGWGQKIKSLNLSIDVRVRSSHLFASIGVVQLPWMGILNKSQSSIVRDIEAW